MSRLVAYHAVLAAGTLCLGLSADVRASSCVWFPALAQDFERADRVFLALVTDRAEREQGGRTRAEATLEVLEVFKGEVAPVLHLAAYSKPFAGILELGETWLLFLPEQDWWPSVCSGNMPLADPRAST